MVDMISKEEFFGGKKGDDAAVTLDYDLVYRIYTQVCAVIEEFDRGDLAGFIQKSFDKAVSISQSAMEKLREAENDCTHLKSKVGSLTIESERLKANASSLGKRIEEFERREKFALSVMDIVGAELGEEVDFSNIVDVIKRKINVFGSVLDDNICKMFGGENDLTWPMIAEKYKKSQNKNVELVELLKTCGAEMDELRNENARLSQSCSGNEKGCCSNKGSRHDGEYFDYEYSEGLSRSDVDDVKKALNELRPVISVFKKIGGVINFVESKFIR